MPIKKTGGLVILRGNLAPDGCVVKIAGYAAHNHTGPARVFDSEEATFAALKAGQINGGRRRRHPLRGAERRSGDARDARRSPARSRARASANRSRCSRTAASRARPGDSWPATWRRKRPRGGPIAAVREGDTITFDFDTRELRLEIGDAEIKARLSTWTPPKPRYETGVLAKYARLVSSAATGAITG